MSNQWLRLWHEMPNDPKWRTIARISAQPISLVQAVYLHLLVDASRNVTRGHATVTTEDLASALDVTEDAIKAVLLAMQSRVLDEMRLIGWEARQPKREDFGDETTGAKSSAQRKADQRERERVAAEEQQCHDKSRNVTTDKDKTREESSLRSELSLVAFEAAWLAYPTRPGASKADSLKAWSARVKAGADADSMVAGVRRYAAFCIASGTEPQFIKQPVTFFGPGEHFLADWAISQAGAARTRPGAGKYAAAAAGVFGAPQQHSEVIDV